MMKDLDPRFTRQWSRRRLNLALLVSAFAASAAGGVLGTRPASAQPRLQPTPSDFEGPYRPPRGTAWGGVDLMSTRDAASSGRQLVFAGRLLDTSGRALSGLQVQVWQANATGRYDYHPAETPGHGRPDPGFRGHGQSDVDSDGWFAFRTIRPGGYRRTLFGFLPWTFVPHIHVAIREGDRDLLVTQSDLDRQAARQPATAFADHARLMQSDAIRRLTERVGGGVVGQAELIRFDVVLDWPG